VLKKLLMTGAMLASFGQPSHAAQFSYALSNDKSYTYVYITGDIESDDDTEFDNYTKNLPANRVVVVLNSDGGLVRPGINIGLRINFMHWDTMVYSNTTCASMCGLIWLGGSGRYAGRSAHIGFHGIYNFDTKQPGAVGNAWVGAYLYKLGFSFRTIAELVKAPPTGMAWLTAEKAKEYGITAKTIQ
jgi:hypothetical protein